MTNLLLRIFVKDYQNVNSSKVREKYGFLSSIVGLLINFFLFLSKFIVGTMTNILSITADGFNNLSDGLGNIISLVSFKLSNKPADKRHPYGHERIEYIASSIVSFLVLLIGINLLKDSFIKIIHPTTTTFSYSLILVLSLSILLKFFLYVFNDRLAKLISSELLRAVSKDSLGDILSTSVVLVSVIISKLTNIELDGIMGLVVSVMIIKTGIELILESFDELIGKAPDPEFIKMIKSYVRDQDGILGVHDVLCHTYGANKIFMTIHCEVDANIDSLISHDIIDNIEREVHEYFDVNLVIHMDPVDTKNEKINHYKGAVTEIIKGIDTRLHIHDFRAVFGPSHDNLVFDIEKPFDLKMSNEELISTLKARLDERYVDHVVYPVVTIDITY